MWTCGIAIATQHANPRQGERSLQHRGRQAECPCRRPGHSTRRPSRLARLAAQQERERQHRKQTEGTDDEVGLAPADRSDQPFDDRGPNRTREVVARCADRDRDAAPSLEPVRDIRKQRHERRRRPKQSDQQPGDDGELAQRRGVSRQAISCTQRDCADQDRQ